MKSSKFAILALMTLLWWAFSPFSIERSHEAVNQPRQPQEQPVVATATPMSDSLPARQPNPALLPASQTLTRSR